jgi:hypothetical protein
MLYAVLCYHDEAITSSWSVEEEAAVVDRLIAVHDKWGEKFRPVLRLMPSTTAMQVKDRGKLVIDGPFAETKEQLLGIYTIEAGDLDQALEIVAELSAANPTAHYEVRPIITYVTDAALGPVTAIPGAASP